MRELVLCTAAALGIGYLVLEYKFLKPRRIKTEVKTFLNVVKHTRFVPPATSTRGIGVAVTTNVFDTNLFMCVAGIRQTGCALPITVFTTIAPRSDQVQALRDNYRNVDVVYRRTDLIKLVAILESPYDQVVLIDSDCMCLQNPEQLVNHHKYLDTGLLLWNGQRRRGILPDSASAWIKSIIPYRRRGNAVLNDLSIQQSSGVLTLFNKTTHPRTLNAILAFVKAWPDLKDTLGANGEHELIWVAAEIGREPYTFTGVEPGRIGRKFGTSVRGLPVYFDEFYNLVAIYDENGHLFESYRSTDLTYYIEDDSPKGRYSTEVIPVSPGNQELIDWYFKNYVQYTTL